MDSCSHRHHGVEGLSAAQAVQLLLQSTWGSTEPSAALELDVARLPGQAAGCLKMAAEKVSARHCPELDYCNWPALAALTDQVDQQLGWGLEVVQPTMHPLEPGHPRLHNQTLVRAATTSAPAAPGNGFGSTSSSL